MNVEQIKKDFLEDTKEDSSSPSELDIKKLQKQLRTLSELVVKEKDAELFMGITLTYIDSIVNFCSSKTLKNQLSICRENFQVLQEVIPDQLRDLFAKKVTKRVFDIVVEDDVKIWCIKKELLKSYIACIEHVDRNVRQQIVQDISDIYLYKIFDCISTYGDYDLQVTLIEVLFRLYREKAIMAKLQDLIPESQELKHNFSQIHGETFDEDCRRFLNSLNETSGRVFSVICRVVYLGNTRCREVTDSIDGFWVDFNIEEKVISWYCDKDSFKNDLDVLDLSEDNSVWNLITLFASDVQSVQVHRPAKSTDVLIIFKLRGSCISSFKDNQEIVGGADNLKLLITFDSEKVSKLLSTILPCLFKNRFFRNRPKVSTSKKTVYKPLKVSTAKHVKSDSSKTRSDGSFLTFVDPAIEKSKSDLNSTTKDDVSLGKKFSISPESSKCEVISISNSSDDLTSISSKNAQANAASQLNSQYETADMFPNDAQPSQSQPKVSKEVKNIKAQESEKLESQVSSMYDEHMFLNDAQQSQSQPKVSKEVKNIKAKESENLETQPSSMYNELLSAEEDMERILILSGRCSGSKVKYSQSSSFPRMTSSTPKKFSQTSMQFNDSIMETINKNLKVSSSQEKYETAEENIESNKSAKVSKDKYSRQAKTEGTEKENVAPRSQKISGSTFVTHKTSFVKIKMSQRETLEDIQEEASFHTASDNSQLNDEATKMSKDKVLAESQKNVLSIKLSKSVVKIEERKGEKVKKVQTKIQSSQIGDEEKVVKYSKDVKLLTGKNEKKVGKIKAGKELKKKSKEVTEDLKHKVKKLPAKNEKQETKTEKMEGESEKKSEETKISKDNNFVDQLERCEDVQMRTEVVEDKNNSECLTTLVPLKNLNESQETELNIEELVVDIERVENIEDYLLEVRIDTKTPPANEKKCDTLNRIQEVQVVDSAPKETHSGRKQEEKIPQTTQSSLKKGNDLVSPDIFDQPDREKVEMEQKPKEPETEKKPLRPDSKSKKEKVEMEPKPKNTEIEEKSLRPDSKSKKEKVEMEQKPKKIETEEKPLRPDSKLKKGKVEMEQKSKKTETEEKPLRPDSKSKKEKLEMEPKPKNTEIEEKPLRPDSKSKKEKVQMEQKPKKTETEEKPSRPDSKSKKEKVEMEQKPKKTETEEKPLRPDSKSKKEKVEIELRPKKTETEEKPLRPDSKSKKEKVEMEQKPKKTETEEKPLRPDSKSKKEKVEMEQKPKKTETEEKPLRPDSKSKKEKVEVEQKPTKTETEEKPSRPDPKSKKEKVEMEQKPQKTETEEKPLRPDSKPKKTVPFEAIEFSSEDEIPLQQLKEKLQKEKNVQENEFYLKDKTPLKKSAETLEKIQEHKKSNRLEKKKALPKKKRPLDTSFSSSDSDCDDLEIHKSKTKLLNNKESAEEWKNFKPVLADVFKPCEEAFDVLWKETFHDGSKNNQTVDQSTGPQDDLGTIEAMKDQNQNKVQTVPDGPQAKEVEEIQKTHIFVESAPEPKNSSKADKENKAQVKTTVDLNTTRHTSVSDSNTFDQTTRDLNLTTSTTLGLKRRRRLFNPNDLSYLQVPEVLKAIQEPAEDNVLTTTKSIYGKTVQRRGKSKKAQHHNRSRLDGSILFEIDEEVPKHQRKTNKTKAVHKEPILEEELDGENAVVDLTEEVLKPEGTGKVTEIVQREAIILEESEESVDISKEPEDIVKPVKRKYAGEIVETVAMVHREDERTDEEIEPKKNFEGRYGKQMVEITTVVENTQKTSSVEGTMNIENSDVPLEKERLDLLETEPIEITDDKEMTKGGSDHHGKYFSQETEKVSDLIETEPTEIADDNEMPKRLANGDSDHHGKGFSQETEKVLDLIDCEQIADSDKIARSESMARETFKRKSKVEHGHITKKRTKKIRKHSTKVVEEKNTEGEISMLDLKKEVFMNSNRDEGTTKDTVAPRQDLSILDLIENEPISDKVKRKKSHIVVELSDDSDDEKKPTKKTRKIRKQKSEIDSGATLADSRFRKTKEKRRQKVPDNVIYLSKFGTTRKTRKSLDLNDSRPLKVENHHVTFPSMDEMMKKKYSKLRPMFHSIVESFREEIGWGSRTMFEVNNTKVKDKVRKSVTKKEMRRTHRDQNVVEKKLVSQKQKTDNSKKIVIISDIQIRPKRPSLEAINEVPHKKLKANEYGEKFEGMENREIPVNSITEDEISTWIATGSPNYTQASEIRCVFKHAYAMWKSLLNTKETGPEYEDAKTICNILRKYV